MNLPNNQLYSTEKLIPAHILCSAYNVEVELVQSFQEQGLIDIITVGDKDCIPISQLPHLHHLISKSREVGPYF